MASHTRRHGLKRGARFSLFIVSYIPLFAIMSFQQIYQNKDFLNPVGITTETFLNFLRYFGVSSFLIIISIFCLIGLLILLRNLERRANESGEVITVTDVENKNSEAIAYLFTYIIPFVFQDLSNISQLVPIIALMSVTYAIYSNSSMMLINPTLSFWYSLYQIEYQDHTGKTKKTIVLTKERFLEEGDTLRPKRIAHKLSYGVA
ncbi:hypothetical protein [Pseudomonas synxantha]|uniref:hypothetical protein n=1 Tax=Pseudomonas synxantha TaxID=47883 RepID=UPI00061486DF|nr:hypothetical protein [Pseudomonas synxantha]